MNFLDCRHKENNTKVQTCSFHVGSTIDLLPQLMLESEARRSYVRDAYFDVLIDTKHLEHQGTYKNIELIIDH